MCLLRSMEDPDLSETQDGCLGTIAPSPNSLAPWSEAPGLGRHELGFAAAVEQNLAVLRLEVSGGSHWGSGGGFGSLEEWQPSPTLTRRFFQWPLTAARGQQRSRTCGWSGGGGHEACNTFFID